MIAGLILAAGESSRMGSDKALLTCQGQTFLEKAFETLRAAGVDRIAVVLGHHAEEIQGAVNLAGAQVVINLYYKQGQTSSLQAGLRALETPDLEAVVLCLVDHPAVTVDALRRLLERFEQTRAQVVIPTFEGQRGHPVVLGRQLFPELLGLNPQEGAHIVVRKYRNATQFVEVEDRGILLDVDDPETYRLLKNAST
jgi:molybdenum cofactor cytidylyltransferase